MIKIESKAKLYDLIEDHLDIKDIMLELGFKDIIKPGMLQSVGKFMTIEKGARAKNINWDYVIRTFKERGYELI